MSDRIVKLLEDAGWYEGRKIDITYVIDELNVRELTLPNTLIKNLFEEYWHIKIEYHTSSDQFGDIVLNSEAAWGVSSKVLHQYEELVKDKIVPAGSLNDDSGALYISYSGKFFLAANEHFYQIGIDFFDALNTIINEKDVTKLW